ncbi:hypothetical protein G8770_06135 [Aestuariicella hydrocarbonica]|uniref:Uncharacterized protein n=1 Tax=Pseudomaricurvus hydrocarbonicus TaxID=1470433 RepID=A0A9E5JR18_9GAMM|nr:hypothetical protein [Aestuariicella hydrocarbonica]NHO65118.1 hypothetical protein [Aestuariicella hydrocarbonica]
MKHLITVLLLTAATTAFAGPKSLKDAGSGETSDGRTFNKIEVACHGSSDAREIIQLEGSRKWCLSDESYCGKKMRAAKKACK